MQYWNKMKLITNLSLIQHSDFKGKRLLKICSAFQIQIQHKPESIITFEITLATDFLM
jgi:hypothetical protein